MNRKDFLIERQKGIGGSDVSGLVAAELPELGLAPFKTPLEIYYSKILEPEEHEATIAQKRGNNAENLVAEIYSQKIGVEITDNQPPFSQKDFMIAHPDKYVSASDIRYILECKTVHHSKANAWKKIAPLEYWLQCIHYAIVCDVPQVDIAGMIGFEGLSGDDEFFKIYSYHRNEKLEKRIIEIEEKFWENHVLKRKPPAPMTLSDTILLHPHSIKTKKVVASKEIQEIIQKEKEAYLQHKKYEEESKKLRVKIAEFMEDAYRLVDKDDKSLATNSASERKSVDYKKLKELAGEEIYNQVVSTSTSKRLSPTRK